MTAINEHSGKFYITAMKTIGLTLCRRCTVNYCEIINVSRRFREELLIN